MLSRRLAKNAQRLAATGAVGIGDRPDGGIRRRSPTRIRGAVLLGYHRPASRLSRCSASRARRFTMTGAVGIGVCPAGTITCTTPTRTRCAVVPLGSRSPAWRRVARSAATARRALVRRAPFEDFGAASDGKQFDLGEFDHGGASSKAATSFSPRAAISRLSHADAIRTLARRGLSRHLDRSLLPSTQCGRGAIAKNEDASQVSCRR
jgi:hypothetical protein